MEAFQAAEKDVAMKAGELKEISVAYEKAKSLADKIRGVEVDITLQLQEYAKVFTRGILEIYLVVLCTLWLRAYLFTFYFSSIACEDRVEAVADGVDGGCWVYSCGFH